MPQVLHNALRRITALQRAYRNALGANDDPAFRGIERAGETLTPVMNLWSLPEWAALRGEIRWGYFSAVSAVAGELSFVGIRNPANSGLLCVVEGMWGFQGGSGVTNLHHGPSLATDIDGLEQVVPDDTRFNLAGVSQVLGFHGTGVAAIGNNALYRIIMGTGANTEYRGNVLHRPAVLTPGFDLRLYGGAANLSLQLNFWGRVRPASPEELAQIQG